MSGIASGEEVSREELLQYLEQATGRRLNSKEEIYNFLRDLPPRNPELDPGVRRWRSAKKGVWLLLLALAFMQYFLLDTLNDALHLQGVNFTVPPAASRAVRI